jgi:hypothetical protein
MRRLHIGYRNLFVDAVYRGCSRQVRPHRTVLGSDKHAVVARGWQPMRYKQPGLAPPDRHQLHRQSRHRTSNSWPGRCTVVATDHGLTARTWWQDSRTPTPGCPLPASEGFPYRRRRGIHGDSVSRRVRSALPDGLRFRHERVTDLASAGHATCCVRARTRLCAPCNTVWVRLAARDLCVIEAPAVSIETLHIVGRELIRSDPFRVSAERCGPPV